MLYQHNHPVILKQAFHFLLWYGPLIPLETCQSSIDTADLTRNVDDTGDTSKPTEPFNVLSVNPASNLDFPELGLCVMLEGLTPPSRR